MVLLSRLRMWGALHTEQINRKGEKTAVSILPSIVVNTLFLASMYILASLGFAFIFNMLGTVNLATAAFTCWRPTSPII